jgi:hypothetical protein
MSATQDGSTKSVVKAVACIGECLGERRRLTWLLESPLLQIGVDRAAGGDVRLCKREISCKPPHSLRIGAAKSYLRCGGEEVDAAGAVVLHLMEAFLLLRWRGHVLGDQRFALQLHVIACLVHGTRKKRRRLDLRRASCGRLEIRGTWPGTVPQHTTIAGRSARAVETS